MIEGVILLWYVLTAGSLAFVIWDQLYNTPSTTVMKIAWVLVTFYTGPVGLFVYLLSCRQSLPGTHDAYIAAHWKQSVGSLSHCLAGDATGIVLAASIVYFLGLSNGWDLVAEYVSGFIFGLFIFQALFMLNMYDGDYGRAVRGVFFAETVSMNMLMTGMFTVMLILMHMIEGGDNPFSPRFWFIMSMASIAGAFTAYPINSWMVGRGIKHGMMSAPSSGGGMQMADGMEMAMNDGNGGHEGHGLGAGAATKLPTGQAFLVMGGTFALLIVVILIVGIFVPIRFN
ncbi:MAG: DUF4396 domain-containing protein [Hyphomicrobiales bacterium]|nr:DUF4396 domain-containing protein [Hyphomicrobiales bacterium]